MAKSSYKPPHKPQNPKRRRPLTNQSSASAHNLDSFPHHNPPALLTRYQSLCPCGLRGQDQLQHLSPLRRQATQSSTFAPDTPPNPVTSAAALFFKQQFCSISDLLVPFIITTIRHLSSPNCLQFLIEFPLTLLLLPSTSTRRPLHPSKLSKAVSAFAPVQNQNSVMYECAFGSMSFLSAQVNNKAIKQTCLASPS